MIPYVLYWWLERGITLLKTCTQKQNIDSKDDRIKSMVGRCFSVFIVDFEWFTRTNISSPNVKHQSHYVSNDSEWKPSKSLQWYHYICSETITYQKQPPEVFCKKGILRNFAKFTGKHLCQSLFFNKVTGFRLAAL